MIGTKPIITATVISLVLVACGGGSSGSSIGSNPTPVASQTYLNQVAVSGLAANEQVILQNNNTNPITVSANQTITFPASWQTTNAYAVTVASQTPGITCGTSSTTGTMGTADVTVTVSCGAGTESVLYSFASGTGDGANPQAGLITDASGNLYGTTQAGGANSKGTVFKLTPNGVGGYTESVLHSFVGSDGANPGAPLIMDANGNLYGTTVYGATNNNGTVFKLTADGSGGYTESTLYSFAVDTNGGNSQSALIIDKNGNLYGTNFDGGVNGVGTVFKLTPNGTGGYTESVLHSFIGSDGAYPPAGLIIDTNGNLYGTTQAGGANSKGTVFKLTPNGVSGYTESVLHSFVGSDGAYPTTSLITDTNGNLYGTTNGGGANAKGTVFKLTLDGSGSYTESVLYSFGTGTDGANPNASLIADTSGNLYGTTQAGGTNNNGTVYKLTPSSSGGYTESVLYSFSTGSDGASPAASLFTDAFGNLYGTTYVGGTNNSGTIFKIN
jgi:uncharacterized repeat protein (TIGR03803 family)